MILRKFQDICTPTLYMLSFCVIMLVPSAGYAETREERVERERQEARELKKQMRYKYGGACPDGTEAAGGFPPDNRHMYCRYPTNKGPVKHGKYYKWWPDGSVRVEGQYWQGKKHGVWTSYLSNGYKKRQDTYYAGKRRESLRFDRDGQAQEILNSRQRRNASKDRRKRRFRGDF